MAPKGSDFALALVQLLPAVIISTGINFAVAYAMYHSQRNINFFPFPNTLAGDLAVTNFIQGALNYLFPAATLELDSRLGRRIPWRGFMNPPLGLVDRISRLTGRSKFFWNLLLQSEDISSPVPKRDPMTILRRLAFTILRGLFLSVFLFLITWSIAVAIACPIYCGKNIASRWAPQAIKAIYGGVHALIEIPIASFLIILGIDVRHHRNGSEAKPFKGNNGAAVPAPSATPSSIGTDHGNIGQLHDPVTNTAVLIDTRTAEPLNASQPSQSLR